MKLLRPILRPTAARRDGATSVEVALTLPIFGILLAGIMEFCHFFMVVHTLNGAARKGAHYGSYQGVTNTQVTTQVQTIVSGAFASSKATVQICDGAVFDTSNFNASTTNYNTLSTVDLTQCKTGANFVVQVSVPYNNVALLPPWWIQGATVTGRAVMRHE